MPKIKCICPECGKEFYQYPCYIKQGIKRCSRKCQGKYLSGENNPIYKRGYTVSGGYKMICVNNEKVYEHRYIMEQHIGRKLKPGEEIHHIDGNKMNNSINNLMLLTMEEHKKFHRDKKTGKFISRIIEENNKEETK